MSEKGILSITTSGHGVGATVCLDGKIEVATTLERLTRKKHDIMFPMSKEDLKTMGWKEDPSVYKNALDLDFDFENDFSSIKFESFEKWDTLLSYLFKATGTTLKDFDTVVYSYRLNKQAGSFFKEKNPNVEFIIPEHHIAHAAQAFLPSQFNEAAILVVDGQGVPLTRTNFDQLSGCMAYGKDSNIKVLHEFPVNKSLGELYHSFTKKCGFKTNEECKTMGLASYGRPSFYEKLKKEIFLEQSLINLRELKNLIENGTNTSAIIYSLGRYHQFLNSFPNHVKGEPFNELYQDIAYAGQKVLEDVLIHLANWLYAKTKSKNLCIAGGVGLNCVANYQILSKTPFENIFIYPCTGDTGLPVGQALYAHNVLHKKPRNYIANHDYLGRAYTRQEIEKAINEYRSNDLINISEFPNLPDLYKTLAEYIAKGHITSWWQGKSEYGPRALGNRSILADPRRKDMKDILNERVKFREGFRPFTPSVLKEKSSDYFTLDIESPYMLLAPYVKPGKGEVVPSITHIDNTARVQTVDRNVNERYYDLIKTFEKITGVPMLLNTSFNVAGEPIVETPIDAIKCFLSTDIDVLGLDTFILTKKNKNLDLERV